MDTTTAGATLLLVVAHPDDETFGCGSLLLHAAATGARTVVVCATRGEAGVVAPGVEVPGGDLGRLREAELRGAAAALGVSVVDVLDLRDSGMDGEPGAGSLCATPVADVAELVRAAVARHRPTVVVTLAGSDGHRDHRHLADAVTLAVAGTGLPLYQACLPRSLLQDWLRWRAGDAQGRSYQDVPDIGTPDEEVSVVLDVAEHLPRRDAAIAHHRSQQSPFDGLPDELRRRFLATDHLVRVQPARAGGPVEDALLGLGPEPTAPGGRGTTPG